MDCGLQTGGEMKTEGKMQTADCRLVTESCGHLHHLESAGVRRE